MDLENQLSGHLRRLCVEIGPRPIGSPENHAAADYIRQVFRRSGLDIEEQRLPCPAWKADETSLELDGESLSAAANVYSPGCNVFAPTVALGTIADLEAANLGDRVALLYGELATGPLTTKGCLLYDAELDWKIVRLLEEKRPEAIITVNPRLGCLERLIEDWEFSIPSVTVPAEMGLTLLEKARHPAQLRISTTTTPSDSANVIGRKPGARDERIVLCAHYDTKIETPGAWDNGCGVAALLTLASLFKEQELSIGLEFVAFTAEEYGTGLHDVEYVRRAGDGFAETLAAVNMDGVGHRLRTDSVAIMAHSEPFRALVDDLLRPRPSMVWTDPWPQSNHSTFAYRGIPSIALGSIGRGAGDFGHSPADTVAWISPSKGVEVVSLVADIVARLQDKALGWTRATRSEES